MTSPHLDRHEPNRSMDDDRYGLDVFAEAIDDVAAQLPPSNLVPLASPETRHVAPPDKQGHATSLPPSPAAAGNSMASRWMGLAAAVLIALLAWSAYLGWVQLPQVERQLAEVRSANGPVELTWLSPPRQGERTVTSPPPTQLRIPSKGSAVWLLELPQDLRSRLQDGAQIELSPTSEDAAHGVQTFQWSLDADTLADHLAQHDGVPLLLGGTELPTGAYRLQWLDPHGNPVSAVDLELIE